MHYVTVLQDKIYLLWQLEILHENLKELGEADQLIAVVVFDGVISDYAKELGQKIRIVFCRDLDEHRAYVAAVKPYGLMRLLKAYPELGQNLFLIDTDVLFREKIDFSKFEKQAYYMSDCANYLGYDYLQNQMDLQQLKRMTDVVSPDLTWEILCEKDRLSGGAQYFFHQIDWEFCEKVRKDSVSLYVTLKELEEEGSNVQVWTAEMWAWLWNAFLTQEVMISQELNFCWATDPADRWESTKILHLSGIMDHKTGHFYKGRYTKTKPWEDKDTSYITKKNHCSHVYWQHIVRYRGSKDEKHQNLHQILDDAGNHPDRVLHADGDHRDVQRGDQQ